MQMGDEMVLSPVKSEEKDILINLSDFKAFSNKGGKTWKQLFMIKTSFNNVIPLLREYFNIMKDPKNEYRQLSKVMHGYEEGSIDIAAIYKEALTIQLNLEEIISCRRCIKRFY